VVQADLEGKNAEFISPDVFVEKLVAADKSVSV
jgi:hypothetical protein